VLGEDLATYLLYLFPIQAITLPVYQSLAISWITLNPLFCVSELSSFRMPGSRIL
jgi:hypothetical protein